jgi:hypothetical protein
MKARREAEYHLILDEREMFVLLKALDTGAPDDDEVDRLHDALEAILPHAVHGVGGRRLWPHKVNIPPRRPKETPDA